MVTWEMELVEFAVHVSTFLIKKTSLTHKGKELSLGYAPTITQLLQILLINATRLNESIKG